MAPAATKTRERIQDVARDLFAERGLRNTSLQDIAARLEITKPALYYHFSSRDDLVRSIVRPMVDDLEEFLAARTPGDRRQLLEDYFDVLWAHRVVLSIIIRDLATLGQLELGGWMIEWRRRLIALLAGAKPSVVQMVRATVALGGLSDCAIEYADRSQRQVKKAAVDAAIAALDS
ncbi:TetR/AcrR family transcriptional regulator [Mycobacterium sp. CBMA271]|uniref:TetR/AcrR family transcriptional regulator n=1 Tax=unclassified Mycobacteroides TaxID=2618759 RepID=UPI0012DE4BBA|nr:MULTISPECIES: TetR/AcrR family transcriptional regulator [unclassified Mycobacteroides]MUM18972.1 TetR family transcriptional regulator [Mycobacteroides sp. CBMA 326]MUM22851.1 TetR/AcrR family transcriptional regulator [Mycobacteroides sp. CBMA 271]